MTFGEESSSGMSVGKAQMQRANEINCPQEGSISQLPGSFKVNIAESNIDELYSFYQKLPDGLRKELLKEHSPMVNLLLVNIEPLALITMVNYWDPVYRCLTFKDMDLVPTLEEYSHLLAMPLTPKSPIYVRPKTKVPLDKIAKLYGVTKEELSKEGTKKEGINKEEIDLWPWYFVKNCLQKFCDDSKWEEMKNLFVASIYGMVVFPVFKNSISHEALNVYFQVVNNKVNPVPAILADTLLSLNYCRRKKQSRLNCCLKLLYVWVLCHLWGKKFRLLTSYSLASNTMHFSKEKLHQSWNRQQWLQEYGNFFSQDAKFCIHSTTGSGILHSCGRFSYVPLIGTLGCISYTPLLALRQYGKRQFIPPTNDLKNLEFFYTKDMDSQLLNKLREAWKHKMFHEGEFCTGGDRIETEYLEWIRCRREHLPLPTVNHSSYPPPSEEVMINFEEVQELKGQLGEAKDKLFQSEMEKHQMQERIAQLEKTVSMLQGEKPIDQLEKANKDKMDLYKRRCEEMSEQLKEYKKQKTEAENEAKGKSLQNEKSTS